jgi:hypothetical protein
MSSSRTASAILRHRYGGLSSPSAGSDWVADQVAQEMFGSIPTAGTGTMQIKPVLAAGVDTGTVHLAPIDPDPDLSQGAISGIETGFAEFVKEYLGSR